MFQPVGQRAWRIFYERPAAQTYGRPSQLGEMAKPAYRAYELSLWDKTGMKIEADVEELAFAYRLMKALGANS